MDTTLICNYSLESCGIILYSGVDKFVFQFYPVCNFGKLINFGLGSVLVVPVDEQGCLSLFYFFGLRVIVYLCCCLSTGTPRNTPFPLFDISDFGRENN